MKTAFVMACLLLMSSSLAMAEPSMEEDGLVDSQAEYLMEDMDSDFYEETSAAEVYDADNAPEETVETDVEDTEAMPVQEPGTALEIESEAESLPLTNEAAENEDASLSVLEMSMPEKQDKKKQRPYEIQMEYLEGRFFDNRKIDRYNLNLFEQVKQNGSISLHRGLTISRMTGYTTDDGIWRDSEAWGIGPAFMVRWEKRLSGKLYGALEASGSLQAYNQAHPAKGRAYGFLWRIGPRLTYRYTSTDALSLGYIFHHTSNGMNSHNPGYNGIGFSIGYQRSF